MRRLDAAFLRLRLYALGLPIGDKLSRSLRPRFNREAGHTVPARFLWSSRYHASMSRSWLFFATVPTAALAYFIYLFWRPPWTPLRIAGLVLLFLGLVFLTVARFQLGKSFSLTPQARQLVTHGLYSRIRNPVYVFGAVVVLGLFLFIDRPYYLLAFLVIIPLQILRARAEASVLEAHFGDEYRQYRSKTWF